MRRSVVMLAVLAACTSHEPAPSEPGPPQKETVKPEGCGELSYGIHHNPGDDFETIAARRLGAIQCATPCDPKPGFALSPEGRNEHGGYGFIEIDPAQCEFPGMSLGVVECDGMCDTADVLGQFMVRLGDETPESRVRLCRAFEQRWGPPDVGSCDCMNDEIVWRPRADEPGAVLHFKGAYSLDCGFPDGNYLPEYPPG